MPRKIENGMRPHFQPHPPKYPRPEKGNFAGQSVAKVAGQSYVNPKKGETVTGKAPIPLLQRKRPSRGQTPPTCRDRLLMDWPRISLSRVAVSVP